MVVTKSVKFANINSELSFAYWEELHSIHIEEVGDLEFDHYLCLNVISTQKRVTLEPFYNKYPFVIQCYLLGQYENEDIRFKKHLSHLLIDENFIDIDAISNIGFNSLLEALEFISVHEETIKGFAIDSIK